MRKTVKSFFGLFLLSAFFFAPAFLNAQAPGSSFETGSGMWFEFAPESPGPNELVTVRFVTYSGQLDTAEIAWFVNGQTYDAGIGLSTISVRTGNIGVPTDVSVIVRFTDGRTLSHEITIVPARVALMWEANSHVPPFYKGKALRGVGQDVTLIALPLFQKNGVSLSPGQLLFEWYVGPTKLPQSGVGKNRIIVQGSSLRIYQNVRVVVSTLDRSARTEAMIDIPSTFPRLHLYEINPLYGRLYERALLGEIRSGTREFSIIAEPYFFDKNQVQNGNAIITWSVNGVPSESQGPIQTFTPVSGAGGRAALSASAADSGNLFMQAVANLSVEYGGTQRTLF